MSELGGQRIEHWPSTGPEGDFAALTLGLKLLADGRHAAAREALARAQALAPQRADVRAALAEVAFRIAADEAPHAAEPWLRRGLARLRSGSRDAARADFEEAVRRDPNCARARLELNKLAFSTWRPTQPAAALGLAVEYLCQKPAFARLPFGEWAQTLFWQTARGHYVFVVDAGQRVVGYLGWAFAAGPAAEAWLAGERGLRNEECLGGDCAIVNVWAADGEAANALVRDAAQTFFGARRAVYFKRHYADGRERAMRLPVPPARARTVP